MLTTTSVAAVASRTRPDQIRLPLPERPPVPPVPPAAMALLNDARQGFAEARQATDPVTKFITSYLAALRAGAAVLAARGRPHRGRARPASVWELLRTAAPELAEWTAYFAANSAARAAAQAGITRRITEQSADQLCRQTGRFVELAGRVVHPRGDTVPPARAKVRRT